MDIRFNIISDSYTSQMANGPSKVITNTIKGLNKIGYPFGLNKDIRDFPNNWIHDSVKGIIEVGLNKIPSVIGPNIAVLPKDLPVFRPKLKNCIYLHPSQWCVDVWEKVGFSECMLRSWPAGIDLDEFNIPKGTDSNNNVMIYFKRRNPLLLKQAIGLVKDMGLVPQVVRFGCYNEDQYKQVLSKSKFGIWIGSSESQGIGLQEALASDLPLIVIECNSLFEKRDNNTYRFSERLRNIKPTSVPYFDESCGIVLNDFSKLENAIKEVTNNLIYYNPREFIKKNLSLEKQANELLSFFDLLDDKHMDYFQKQTNIKRNGNFNLSFRGFIIYTVFVLIRKIKTLLGLINNMIIRLINREQKE